MNNKRTADVNNDRSSTYHQVAHKQDKGCPVNQQSLRKRTIERVTLVIPLHNEVDNIKDVALNTFAAMQAAGYRPRILLVDDGSTDGSLVILEQLTASNPLINYISFSRNFGKEAAIMAGLAECGDDFDAVAYMDSDGQHTAADLLHLLEAAQPPTVDLVCGVRTSRDYQTRRQQRMIHVFYSIFRKFGDAPIDEGAGDFNVMKPKVVAAIRQLREEHPFMKGLVGWVGFRKELVPITIKPRGGGTAKSSTRNMLKLAFGAILSFSSWPLRAWSVIGISSALVAVAYLVMVVVQTALFGRDVPGYATTVVLLLGLGGLQLLSIGIMGEYVARIYDSTKMRPRYIIARRSHDRNASVL